MIALAAFALLAAQSPQVPATTLVTGTVLDAGGKPVPLARVWVTYRNDPLHELASVRTDGSGRFQVKVERGDVLELHATARGMAQVTRWVDTRSPDRMPTAVELFAAATVRGRVRDHDGTPVAGAVVAVGSVRYIGLAFDTVQTTTGADGRYELEHAPPGEVWVSAWTPTRPLASRQVLLRPDRDEDFEFTGEAPLGFEVTVGGLPDGVSAAGWRVWLSHASGPERALPPGLRHGVLDARGTFRAAGLPADQSHHIHITDPAERWSCRSQVYAARDRKQRYGFHPRPAEESSWSVTVVGPDLQPLADVGIVLGLGGQSSATKTGPDGTAAITALCRPKPGVRARLGKSQAWVLSANEQYDDEDEKGPVYSSSAADPVVLHAIPAAALRGQIADQDGRPLAMADVLLEEWNGMRLPRWARVTHVRTAADGTFAMDGLYPLSQRLRLRIVDTRTLWTFDEPLVSGEVTDLGAITAAPSGAISGVVQGASGEPIPGARLFLIQARGPGFDQTELLCDNEGRFRFAPAAAGTWRSSVYWLEGGLEHVGAPIRVTDGKVVEVQLRSQHH